MIEATHVVKIGAVTFSGRGEHGIGFTRLIGWNDLSDIRGSIEAIPDAHGSYNRTHYWQNSLAITLEAAIHAESKQGLDELRLRVLSLLQGAHEMVVTDESGTWVRMVEVQAAKFDDFRSSQRALKLTVDLLAPDPRRYRPAESRNISEVGGGVQVQNPYSASTFPKITVSGSGTNVTVSAGGRRLTYPESFNGNLVFDCLKRRAYLNNQDVTVRLSQRNWLQILPNQSTFFSFTGDVASGTLMNVEYSLASW